ncbi:hypothetical protein [Pseudodesulfovibrio piezophilus]|uniref:Uncharacterized protein n=1 Tax=Pseudodesulfovibrio piezophilus (strain DSM 21447 / JCM 15486 / C1TLV30) TaxID=1322246 RepID=M1WRZ6_PSEP2|nr:hypothetical protein [Pseudodesulfovibrio piezophilus]CCH48627.1 conserved exported protein of unknown function [Pseudodesulfovibrio piezophilus C1TLV30]
MRHFFILICLFSVLTFSSLPASGSEFPDMDICIGKNIVARILCKDVSEVDYVSRVRKNIYLFSVFYANKEARFFVGVYKDMIRVQGKDFMTVTRSIPYHFDETSKCGIVDYSVPDCPTSERIVCCSEKTLDEQLDEKFWDRPIPDLLEEDLRNALQADNASTGTQSDTEQPAQ